MESSHAHAEGLVDSTETEPMIAAAIVAVDVGAGIGTEARRVVDHDVVLLPNLSFGRSGDGSPQIARSSRAQLPPSPQAHLLPVRNKERRTDAGFPSLHLLRPHRHADCNAEERKPRKGQEVQVRKPARMLIDIARDREASLVRVHDQCGIGAEVVRLARVAAAIHLSEAARQRTSRIDPPPVRLKEGAAS